MTTYTLSFELRDLLRDYITIEAAKVVLYAPTSDAMTQRQVIETLVTLTNKGNK